MSTKEITAERPAGSRQASGRELDEPPRPADQTPVGRRWDADRAKATSRSGAQSTPPRIAPHSTRRRRLIRAASLICRTARAASSSVLPAGPALPPAGSQDNRPLSTHARPVAAVAGVRLRPPLKALDPVARVQSTVAAAVHLRSPPLQPDGLGGTPARAVQSASVPDVIDL